MLKLCEHLDFMKLVTRDLFLLTDSGAIQEGTICLKIPCLTVLNNTERPITIEAGRNQLVGRDIKFVTKCVNEIVDAGVEQTHQLKLRMEKQPGE